MPAHAGEAGGAQRRTHRIARRAPLNCARCAAELRAEVRRAAHLVEDQLLRRPKPAVGGFDRATERVAVDERLERRDVGELRVPGDSEPMQQRLFEQLGDERRVDLVADRRRGGRAGLLHAEGVLEQDVVERRAEVGAELWMLDGLGGSGPRGLTWDLRKMSIESALYG